MRCVVYYLGLEDELLGKKKKEHEKLTQENIQHVINLLNSEKPITKKETCQILNITYNTTRLNSIQDFQDKLNFRAKRKAQLRGKPASRRNKRSNTFLS